MPTPTPPPAGMVRFTRWKKVHGPGLWKPQPRKPATKGKGKAKAGKAGKAAAGKGKGKAGKAGKAGPSKATAAGFGLWRSGGSAWSKVGKKRER